MVLLRGIREVQREFRGWWFSNRYRASPAVVERRFSNYLTNQVVGQDALGRDILRGAIYNPFSTQVVNGKLVRDVFENNVIPKAMFSKVSQNLVNILSQHYQPQVNSLINNSFFPVSNQAGFNQTQFSTKSDFQITTQAAPERFVRFCRSPAHAA